jgi:DNA-binding NarL/FixJ family response regulator
MKKTLLMGALSWALAAAGLTVAPQDPAAPAAARAQGAKVTYERLGPADSKKQLHSQRARLLSLAVERGETPTPSDSGSLSVLTPREREVFQLLALGKANKEVAAMLGLSLGTVKKHRENLQRKLDCHSAAELARLAIREGLLTV